VVLLAGLLQVVLPRAAQQPAEQLRVRQVAQQEQLLGLQALRQVQQALRQVQQALRQVQQALLLVQLQLALQRPLVPQLQLLQQLEQLQQLPLQLLRGRLL
jgi:cob(I)alamin adenosyltransferase